MTSNVRNQAQTELMRERTVMSGKAKKFCSCYADFVNLCRSIIKNVVTSELSLIDMELSDIKIMQYFSFCIK